VRHFTRIEPPPPPAPEPTFIESHTSCDVCGHHLDVRVSMFPSAVRISKERAVLICDANMRPIQHSIEEDTMDFCAECFERLFRKTLADHGIDFQQVPK